MQRVQRPLRLQACSIALVLGLASVAAANGTAPLPVADSASDTLKFTHLVSAREIGGGRVLVLDAPGRQIWSVEFRSGTARRVGRTGRGPREYESPFGLLAIGNDSTLLIDPGSRRWSVLRGDSIVSLLALDHPAIQSTAGYITSADTLGRVLGRREDPPRVGRVTYGRGDSSTVILGSIHGGSMHPVATVRRRPMTVEIRAIDARGRVTEASTSVGGPLAAEEGGVLLADGTLALARLEPFRIDWRSAGGMWERGAPLPVPIIALDVRERRAYVARNRDAASIPAAAFPKEVPPFMRGDEALVAVSPNRILVRRTRSADYTRTSYFVIDRYRGLLGEFSVDAEARVLLVTTQWLYVVVKDDEGFERLQRRELPPLLR